MPAPPRHSELLSAALPERHTWTGRPAAGDLAPLPNGPAIYLLTDAHGAAVQLATTQSLRRVLLGRLVGTAREAAGGTRGAPPSPPPAEEHAPPPGADHPERTPAHTPPPEQDVRPSRAADLAAVVRGVRWRGLGCAFEGRWWYWRLTRELYPADYRRLIAFGPAWYLHVDWAQPVPELRVTERVWAAAGEYIGPWMSQREAQQGLAGLWDLFDLCRYPEQVRKAPHGRRCAYAEMGRCDAPCDGSAPLGDYAQRCRQAWEFARGGPEAWLAGADERMRAAAGRCEYERAGQLKQQLEAAREWVRRWASRVEPVEASDRLLALPVTRRRAWKLFLLRSGVLLDGPTIADRRFVDGVGAWLAALPAPAAALPPVVERRETLWLVAHLMFSREREGALLLRRPDWNAAGLEREWRMAAARQGAGESTKPP